MNDINLDTLYAANVNRAPATQYVMTVGELLALIARCRAAEIDRDQFRIERDDRCMEDYILGETIGYEAGLAAERLARLGTVLAAVGMLEAVKIGQLAAVTTERDRERERAGLLQRRVEELAAAEIRLTRERDEAVARERQTVARYEAADKQLRDLEASFSVHYLGNFAGKRRAATWKRLAKRLRRQLLTSRGMRRLDSDCILDLQARLAAETERADKYQHGLDNAVAELANAKEGANAGAKRITDLEEQLRTHVWECGNELLHRVNEDLKARLAASEAGAAKMREIPFNWATIATGSIALDNATDAGRGGESSHVGSTLASFLEEEGIERDVDVSALRAEVERLRADGDEWMRRFEALDDVAVKILAERDQLRALLDEKPTDEQYVRSEQALRDTERDLAAARAHVERLAGALRELRIAHPRFASTLTMLHGDITKHNEIIDAALAAARSRKGDV